MQYVEFLRARNVVVWYAIWGTGFAVISVIIHLLTPGPTVIVSEHGKTLVMGHGNNVIPLIALWIAAGFGAAVVATILGASLACENRSHLELAWTKPVSRLRYALGTMAVDVVGIIAVQVLTFGLIAGSAALELHGRTQFAVGTSDLGVVVRYALFPIAWYALLQGITASLRGQAGIAQGLIWPVAFGLTGLQGTNLGPVWHGIGAVLNTVNPLTYIGYSATIENTTFNVTGFVAGSTGVFALATLALVGSAAALLQWRRLEA